MVRSSNTAFYEKRKDANNKRYSQKFYKIPFFLLEIDDVCVSKRFFMRGGPRLKLFLKFLGNFHFFSVLAISFIIKLNTLYFVVLLLSHILSVLFSYLKHVRLFHPPIPFLAFMDLVTPSLHLRCLAYQKQITFDFRVLFSLTSHLKFSFASTL